MNIAA